MAFNLIVCMKPKIKKSIERLLKADEEVIEKLSGPSQMAAEIIRKDAFGS